jgi:hypothetical protein
MRTLPALESKKFRPRFLTDLQAEDQGALLTGPVNVEML